MDHCTAQHSTEPTTRPPQHHARLSSHQSGEEQKQAHELSSARVGLAGLTGHVTVGLAHSVHVSRGCGLQKPLSRPAMIGGDIGRRKAASSVLPSASSAYDPKRHAARSANNSDSVVCVLAVFAVTVFVVWATRSGGNSSSSTIAVTPTESKIAVAATPDAVAESQAAQPAPVANIAVGALEIDHSSRTIVDAQGIAATDAASVADAAAPAVAPVAAAAAAGAAADTTNSRPKPSEDRNSAGWRKRESKERLKAKARAEAAAAAAAFAQAEKDKHALKPPIIVPPSDLSLREQILKNAAVGSTPPRPPLERQKAFTSLPDAAAAKGQSQSQSDDDEVDAADFMPSVGAASPAGLGMAALPPLVPPASGIPMASKEAPVGTPMVRKDKAGEGVEMAALDYTKPKPELKRKPGVQGDEQAKEAARVAKEAALAKEELARRSGAGGKRASASADTILQQRMSDSKPVASAGAAESDEIAPEYLDASEGDGQSAADGDGEEGAEGGLFEDASAASSDDSEPAEEKESELETREQLTAALAAAIKQGRKALKGAQKKNSKIAVNKQTSSGGGKGKKQSSSGKGKKSKRKAKQQRAAAAKQAKRDRRRKQSNTQLHRPGSNLPRSNWAQTKRQELLAKARAEAAEADDAAHEL